MTVEEFYKISFKICPKKVNIKVMPGLAQTQDD